MGSPEPPSAVYDVEVEQALLGAVLCDNTCFWRLADGSGLRGAHFYDPLHERIYETICGQMDRRGSATPLTLNTALRDDPGLEQVGGLGYLTTLAEVAPALPNVRHYARILRELAERRKLVHIGAELAEGASSSEQAADVAERASQALYEAIWADGPDAGSMSLAEAARNAAALAEKAAANPDQARIGTGLPSVDHALGGLFPRALTTLGASPSMGKTGLVAQFALSAARAGYATLVFSKEMAAEELATRYLASETGIASNRISEGRFNEAEFEKIVLASGNFDDIPYRLDASTNLTVSQMRARAMAMRRRNGALHLVVVDHLRFIKPAERRADFSEQMQQITRDLKALAKEMDVAVLLVAHLNRDFWKRPGHRPTIPDLYGASAIEQNADLIWFLHREQYFLEREAPSESDPKAYAEWYAKAEQAKGWAELFSAKRRNGPLGSVKLRFDSQFVKFSEADAEEEPPKTGELVF